MPIYHATPYELSFSRRAIILDTNILIAAFDPNDAKHADANAFLDITEDQIIVPVSVIVEAWGLLVGSRGRWDYGIRLLAWVNNPGNAALILQSIDSFESIQEIITRMRVDCVDACIMRIGHEMSNQCDLRPPIRIATYDTSDFVKCIIPFKLRILIRNADTLDDEEYEIL